MKTQNDFLEILINEVLTECENKITIDSNFKELDLVRDKLKLYSRSSVLFDSNKFSLEFADSLKEIWKVYLENR